MPLQKNSYRLELICVAVGLVMLVALFYAFGSKSNAHARSEVHRILTGPGQQKEVLMQLKPYIKLGDRREQVQRRLSPLQENLKPLSRPAEWRISVGDDVQLIVAMKQSGEVVGIGRWRKGIDQGEDWLAAPKW